MLKKGVLVGCKDCVRNLDPKNQDQFIVEDFGEFDVVHCPHVEVLQRTFFPQWKSVSKDNGEESNSKEEKPKSCA